MKISPTQYILSLRMVNAQSLLENTDYKIGEIAEIVGYDNQLYFSRVFRKEYVDVNDKNIFYYVDCSIIQDYGQVETFDNEHTVYGRIKVGTADATLGTNNSGGRTGYVLVWEKDGISHTIIGKIPREEILKIAESIS